MRQDLRSFHLATGVAREAAWTFPATRVRCRGMRASQFPTQGRPLDDDVVTRKRCTCRHVDGPSMGKPAVCEHCSSPFDYDLLHNGFNESAYAYCDHCGCTAIISAWSKRPRLAPVVFHKAIEDNVEPYLTNCHCGGHFRASGSPRCPTCKLALSAQLATSYIEASAPGAAKGWKWQQDWTGLYAIVINGYIVRDPWRPELITSGG